MASGDGGGLPVKLFSAVGGLVVIELDRNLSQFKVHAAGLQSQHGPAGIPSTALVIIKSHSKGVEPPVVHGNLRGSSCCSQATAPVKKCRTILAYIYIYI